MDAQSFLEKYGQSTRPIQEIVQKWKLEKDVEGFLRTHVGEGVIIADYFMDQRLFERIEKKIEIPDELKHSMENLMGEKADSVSEIKALFLEKRAISEESLRGFMRKVQGQLGEDQFIESLGGAATLAESGSQAGWDVRIPREDGVEFVQVKVYADADSVLDKIKEVNNRAVAGGILDEAQQQVAQVNFAVNSDIYDEVSAKVQELGLPNQLYDIGASREEILAILDRGERASRDVTEIAQDLAIEDFFSELTGAVVTYTVAYAALNGLLVYLGAKEQGQWADDTAYQVMAGASGVAAATLADGLLFAKLEATLGTLGGPVTFGGVLVVGMGARALMRRFGDRRYLVRRLVEGTEELAELQGRLAA